MPLREPAVEGSIEVASTQACVSVLLVEDNPVNQRVSTVMLEVLGIRVVVAEDGLQAVAMAGTERFDLVLMDLAMPHLDGLEATRAIRLMAAYRHVPIIAFTADSQGEARQRCLSAGMDDLIAKPIQAQELHSRLRQWLWLPADAGLGDAAAASG